MSHEQQMLEAHGVRRPLQLDNIGDPDTGWMTFDTYVSLPLPPGRPSMPLDQFPHDHRMAIITAALAPTKPPRWMDFTDAQIPSRAWYEWHWCRGIDPERVRRSLPSSLREYVIERDGLVCRLCQAPVDRSDVHIDHIIPVAHGGTDLPGNLQVTHSRCNLQKGANA